MLELLLQKMKVMTAFVVSGRGELMLEILTHSNEKRRF